MYSGSLKRGATRIAQSLISNHQRPFTSSGIPSSSHQGGLSQCRQLAKGLAENGTAASKQAGKMAPTAAPPTTAGAVQQAARRAPLTPLDANTTCLTMSEQDFLLAPGSARGLCGVAAAAPEAASPPAPAQSIPVDLPTDYQRFIHLSRYARWDYRKHRRETWAETVERYFRFFEGHLERMCGFELDKRVRAQLAHAVGTLQVMPSMRAVMTAGPALERENVAGYNCAYCRIDGVSRFAEVLYILMNGTGVGYSVCQDAISKLPPVPASLAHPPLVSDPSSPAPVIVVEDNKEGWSEAFDRVVRTLFDGKVPVWDMSHVRPAGTPLRTFGGRASGPEPLNELFEFTVRSFIRAAGRRFTSLEVHDIICKVAAVIVSGGVRRSALISLSDVDDPDMRGCKSGAWWEHSPHRALANVSAIYKGKPSALTFMREWTALCESGSGERGIYNTDACRRISSRHTHEDGTLRRQPRDDFGTNPCCEVILRSCQFCNLSEVVIRADDTRASLEAKVRSATILGTWQSTLTKFGPRLSPEWKKNTVEERLLGVSLTGIMDSSLTNGTGPGGLDTLAELLQHLRQVAYETNLEWSRKLGIEPSAAITCIKPSGTVSQLCDCSSGIHPRHSAYYIRTVRMDKNDPLCRFMQERGYPHEADAMNPLRSVVFSFPVAAPASSVFRKDQNALQMLELWRLYQTHWCEHKPSVTVSVRESEWMAVGAWVYDHFDEASGIAFLPYSDHVYKQAPYQEVGVEEYEALRARMPSTVQWEELGEFEKTDNTNVTSEFACTGINCEA
eukprot:jgi/Mesvir1/116/Mv07785-RA.1